MSNLPAKATLHKLNERIQVLFNNKDDARHWYAVMLNLFDKNPTLANCTPDSLASAILMSAELGLDVGTIYGHAYILPYRKSVKRSSGWDKVWEAQFIPGYKGLIEVLYQSGIVKRIHAEVVYKSEVENGNYKEFKGLDPRIEHIASYAPIENSEQPYMSYAVALLHTGEYVFHVCTPDEIDNARAKSESYQSDLKRIKDQGAGAALYSPWNNTPKDMYKKTAIRKLFAYLPKKNCSKFIKLLEHENEIEYGHLTVHDDKQNDTATKIEDLFNEAIEQTEEQQEHIDVAALPDNTDTDTTIEISHKVRGKKLVSNEQEAAEKSAMQVPDILF